MGKNKLLDATINNPSGDENISSYRFVVIEDPITKEKTFISYELILEGFNEYAFCDCDSSQKLSNNGTKDNYE